MDKTKMTNRQIHNLSKRFEPPFSKIHLKSRQKSVRIWKIRTVNNLTNFA